MEIDLINILNLSIISINILPKWNMQDTHIQPVLYAKENFWYVKPSNLCVKHLKQKINVHYVMH